MLRLEFSDRMPLRVPTTLLLETCAPAWSGNDGLRTSTKRMALDGSCPAFATSRNVFPVTSACQEDCISRPAHSEIGPPEYTSPFRPSGRVSNAFAWMVVAVLHRTSNKRCRPARSLLAIVALATESTRIWGP